LEDEGIDKVIQCEAAKKIVGLEEIVRPEVKAEGIVEERHH